MYMTWFPTRRNNTQIDIQALLTATTAPTLPYSDFEKFTKYFEEDNTIPVAISAKRNILTKINNLAEAIQTLFNTADMAKHYDTFFIPKSSGGNRRIDAPKFDLKIMETSVKNLFEDTIKILPHNCAHAYVKNRCTKTAMEQHQKNNSVWFLKIDLKDFFTNCTPDWILKQLKQLYPIAPMLIEYPEMEEKLKTIISVGILNNGLPQGSPLSPYLTNIIMTPIDHKLTRYLAGHFCYTRYADDLTISSPHPFNKTQISNLIKKILREEQAPFQINENKTRYGSRNGRNWNLGLMLNKDNNITIGYRKKERFRASLNNFCLSLTTNQPWSIIEVQHLNGLLSYYSSIEPQYVYDMLTKYGIKYNINIKNEIKNIIRA